jgi:hypothetical protein
MTRKTKIIAGSLLLLASAAFGAFALLRLTNMGVLITPLGQTDPSGIGMLCKGRWKVWNLWPSPVSLAIDKKTCACVSSDTGNGPLLFARSRTISMTVSAINKSGNFEEKALLALARGKTKADSVLTIRGTHFAGIYVWPDAIKVPSAAPDRHCELVKLRFHRDISFEDISVKTAGNSDVRLQWASKQPVPVEDGTYAQTTLKVTVNPNTNYQDHLVFAVKGKPVKTVRIF